MGVRRQTLIIIALAVCWQWVMYGGGNGACRVFLQSVAMYKLDKNEVLLYTISIAECVRWDAIG